MYIRKTEDEYVLLANYGQGWEEETIETTYQQIKQRLKEYRENAGMYAYKWFKRRVSILKTKLEDFGVDLNLLIRDERNNKQLSQNHFGDFLMIQEPKEWCKTHNYRVWLNHPDNVAQGESAWLIEYAGELNGFTWKTIAKGNR